MVRPLVGGLSHVNHALLAESRSGTVHRLVLRRWASGSWPDVDIEFSPEREIAALTLLTGCEIPTPSLVAADPSGAHCEMPDPADHDACSATRRARPRQELPEYLIQLAAGLLSVHAVGGAVHDAALPPVQPPRRPPRADQRPAPRACGSRRSTSRPVRRPAPRRTSSTATTTPDNTLWAYGRLTGIVDWSGASHGPAAVDVAHMRWNLALRYGVRSPTVSSARSTRSPAATAQPLLGPAHRARPAARASRPTDHRRPRCPSWKTSCEALVELGAPAATF